MRIFRGSFALVLCGALAGSAQAQFQTANTKGPRIDKTSKQTWRVGMIVTAVGGPCSGVFGTAPVPTDWPEQQVTIAKEEVTGGVKNIRYRVLSNGVKQMLVEIPQLASGGEARALITFEVVRSTLLPPENTSIFTIPPKKVDRETALFLGPSPMIESRHPKIAALAKELIANKESAWEKVEAFYDGVKERVEYKNGPLKGALKALADGTGDCEEMASLFIALCRASDIPARTVWVPGHCYPEFYLLDDEGKGHWFPCNLTTNAKVFGGIPEDRPILQKGDSFEDPDRPNKKLRYVSEFLRGNSSKGAGSPKVQFMRDLL